MAEDTPTPVPNPTRGGSYERLPDGTLRLIEATDHTPEEAPPGTPDEESPQ